MTEPRFTEAGAKRLHARAVKAGLAAAKAAKPTPMLVGSPTHPLGSDINPSKPVYLSLNGPSGFAYVTLPKGTTSFARRAMKSLGYFKHYRGGVAMMVHLPREWGPGIQSMERCSAYASAYARVLAEAGVEVSTESRMD